MDLNKKVVAEGFATILIAALLGAFITWMGWSSTTLTDTPVPGLVSDMTTMFLMTIVIGVFLMSAIFLLVHSITSDTSALMVLIIAVLIMWILGGSIAVTTLIVSVVLVFIGNMAAKYFDVDKKIHSIIK